MFRQENIMVNIVEGRRKVSTDHTNLTKFIGYKILGNRKICQSVPIARARNKLHCITFQTFWAKWKLNCNYYFLHDQNRYFHKTP